MKRLLIVLVALGLLAGCSASNMARVETQSGKTYTVLHSNNASLASRLSVHDINIGRAGDLMKMQATLENRWKFESDFQYQIKWFDKDGFEIQPEAQAWQQLVMPGRTQVNVQAVAPNPTAVRFEIWVQE